jgi:hypothetical protein
MEARGNTDGECAIGRRWEGNDMCANCGCGIPENTHGDDRNISWTQVVASAEANDISPSEAIENMRRMAEQQG